MSFSLSSLFRKSRKNDAPTATGAAGNTARPEPKFKVLAWVGTHYTFKFDQASFPKGYLNLWFEYPDIGAEFVSSHMGGFVSGFRLVAIRNREQGTPGTNVIYQVDRGHSVSVPGVDIVPGESVIGVEDCDFKCEMTVSFRPSTDHADGMVPLFSHEI